MRQVYEAENLIDAHLVRGWLEQAGIAAWVRGDLLTGGMGALPVHGLVSVWVADADVPAAVAEVALLEADRRRAGTADHAAGMADGTDGGDGTVDLCPASGRLA